MSGGGDPKEDYMHSIPHEERLVNLRGLPLDEVERIPTVTISLLSEGEHLCDLCGENIEGLAAYVTVPDGNRRDGFQEVALLCAEHVEFEETHSGPEHVRKALADVRLRRVERRLRRVPGAVLTTDEVLARFAGDERRGAV